MTASPERRARHNGATAQTLATPYAVGTITRDGVIVQVRRKNHFSRRYLVEMHGTAQRVWLRHDEIVPAGGAA
jgi:hypothetical protein